MGWKELWDEAAKKGETKLNLDNQGLDDAAVAAIAGRLATDSTLKELHLDRNQIGDFGSSKIGQSLGTNTTLITLHLSYNEIRDAGVCSIGEALKKNSTLEILNLQNNLIGDVGASKIGELLSTNTTLIKIGLNFNQIGDVGARKIGESLATNITLTNLYLDFNKMTLRGIRALAHSQLHRTSAIHFGTETNKLVAQLKRDQEVWDRLKDDLVPAKTCKAILCGRWGAGKTTLRRSLEALGNSIGGGVTMRRPASNTVQTDDGRTIGMEVVRVKCSDGSGNAMMVHDIGGQDEFHVQHDRIMGDESAIFVVLCNLAAETIVDGKAVKYDAFNELSHLTYWLGYILMHNETLKKPRVLIVGTRGINRQYEATNLMNQCVTAYHDTLDLHTAMYCIDASLPRDDNTMAFWSNLQAEVKAKLVDVMTPRFCAKIIENQSRWCRRYGVILRWDQFFRLVLQTIAPLMLEEVLRDLCEFLHRHGHLLFYRENAHLNQFIVLNPTAFSQTIGALLAPSSLGTDRPGFNAGVCSLNEICDKFPNLTHAEVVKMLDHFELAYELPSENLLFPVHLPRLSGSAPIVCADPRLDMNFPPILLCRRFASRSDAGRMTHGTFPRFQVRLHRGFQDKLQLKQHYAHLSNAADQVFATLVYHELRGFVDVAVWGQPSEVYQLAGKLREILYEDHMLLLRMHEQAISAQMTFDGVAWPLSVAISLSDLERMKISALVDWYAMTPNHLRHAIKANHRCERVASLLHGYPAWGTGQRGISLDELFEELVLFREEYHNHVSNP